MKTAVTQLIERLKNDWNISLSDNVVEFYLKEEKDQIEQTWNASRTEMHNSFSNDFYKRKDFKQYYNETYTQSS